MVALICLFLLLPQQKAGQSVVQMSFNYTKQDTLKVNSLILFRWEDVRKDGGWFELHIQPDGAKGWSKHDFIYRTDKTIRLSKGFVYNVIVLVKDRNDKLVRASKIRKLKVK